MTTTMPVVRTPRNRAPDYRPHHVAAPIVELAQLASEPVKTVERKLLQLRAYLDWMPEAARRAGDTAWLNRFMAHFDAARAVREAPLTVTAGMFCSVNHAVLKEAQRVTECSAHGDKAHRVALLAESIRARTALNEMILSLQAGV